MTTSASVAILRTTSCPSAVLRSTVTDFLLRFCTYHQREVPRCSFLHLRRGSPSGGSILMTSAPNSEKNFPAKGPAISCPSSTTFNPSKGFVTDRKSTRLNSSHRCISYAVFCLKKKNNNKQRDT